MTACCFLVKLVLSEATNKVPSGTARLTRYSGGSFYCVPSPIRHARSVISAYSLGAWDYRSG